MTEDGEQPDYAVAKQPLHEPAGPFAPGTRLGRYLLLAKVGEGGMGVVYSAHDTSLDRKVAVKLVREEHTNSEGSRDRLEREARALARISHQGVVAVHEVGTTDAGHIFVVMEFIEGKTLSKWAAEDAGNWREVVAAFRQAGEALAAIHEVGIVHRDFKLSNALIDEGGRVRVLDFGLAVRTQPRAPGSAPSAPKTKLTPTGMVLGTPFYMAPEVLEGERATAKSDQFAFCAALEKALEAQGDHFTQAAVSADERASATATTRPVRGLVKAARAMRTPEVPAWLRRLIERGKSKNPADRYPTMQALLDDLRRDPRKRAQRLTVVAAAILIAVAGVGGYSYQRAQQRASCEEGAASLSQVWNESVAAEIAQVFTSTELAHATTAWKAISEHIDEWVAKWQEQYRDACEATHVERAQPVEDLGLRMTCLSGRRSELEALVSILSEVNAERLSGTIESAYGMRHPKSCANIEALRAGIAPPTDREMAARVAVARGRLARAEKLFDAARYKESLAIASQVHTEAGTLGYRPLLAEVEHLEGLSHEYLGAFDEALAHYREAELHAVASHHDVVRSKSLNRQAWVVGYKLSQIDQGMQILSRNQALLEWLGERSALLANHLSTRGALLLEDGRPREALKSLQRALEIRERVLGVDATQTMYGRRNVAILSRMLGDYSLGLAHYQQTLAIAKKRFGDNHVLVARLRGSVGEALADVGRYEEAYPITKASRASWRGVLGHKITEGWDTLGGLILQAHELGHVEEARQVAAEFWTLCAENRACRVEALVTRAFVALGQNDLQLAERLAREAYTTLQKRGGVTYLPRSLYYLAQAMRRQGRCAEIVSDLREVTEHVLERTGPRFYWLNLLLHELGLCHLDRGEPSAATEVLERAVDGQTAAGTDPVWLARSQFALARTLLETDRQRAMELANTARDTFALHEKRAAADRDTAEAWLAKGSP